jgi:hypothetical protein
MGKRERDPAIKAFNDRYRAEAARRGIDIRQALGTDTITRYAKEWGIPIPHGYHINDNGLYVDRNIAADIGKSALGFGAIVGGGAALGALGGGGAGAAGATGAGGVGIGETGAVTGLAGSGFGTGGGIGLTGVGGGAASLPAAVTGATEVGAGGALSRVGRTLAKAAPALVPAVGSALTSRGGASGGTPPELQEILNLQKQRMLMQNPLYESILKLAQSRLPTSAQQGPYMLPTLTAPASASPSMASDPMQQAVQRLATTRRPR